MASEMCKTCIHEKVCIHDKRLVGDVYVAPHPLLGREVAKQSWERFLEWEAAGFPCDDYIDKSAPIRSEGEWIDNSQLCVYSCSACKETFGHELFYACGYMMPDFCPNCGAAMRNDNA